MGSTAQAGQALAQGGHTVNQAANEPREEEEVWEGDGRLDGEGEVGSTAQALCLGLSFMFGRWVKTWRWGGGKPHCAACRSDLSS